MSRFAIVLRFTLPLFVLTAAMDAWSYETPSHSFVATSYSADGSVVTIEKPSFGKTPYSSTSDLDALCHYFGHDGKVGDLITEGPFDHLTDGAEEGRWQAAVMNETGHVVTYDAEHPAILKLSCRTDGYLRGGSADLIQVDLLKNAVITHPALADFRGAITPFAATSDPQGICRLLGFDVFVEGSLKTVKKNGITVIVVNNDGHVVGHNSNDDVVRALSCQRDIGAYLPRVNYVVALNKKLAQIIAPRVGGTIPIHQKESNPHGVCHLFGYLSYVPQSEEFADIEGQKAVVDRDGQVVRYQNIGLALAKLTCSVETLDQSADNKLSPNRDGSVTISRPRIVAEPLNGEIADQSDLNGVCRYLGFATAIPESIVKEFWGRGIQQYIVDGQGIPTPRRISVGMIINSITCLEDTQSTGEGAAR